MRVAFVELQVEVANFQEWLIKHFKQGLEEAKAFDSIWDALVFIGEGEKKVLILNKESETEESVVNVALNMDAEVFYVDPNTIPSSYDEFLSWLSLVAEPEDDQDDQPVNPMESILQNKDWEQDAQDEETPDPLDSSEEPTATPSSEESSPEPNSVQVNKTEEDKPRQHSSYRSLTDGSGQPQGLNTKIELTPDLVAMTQKPEKSKGRVSYEPSDKGYCLLVTSGFGGGGKTTVAYYSAQVTGMALKHSNNKKTKVILIEADYDNPKLQNRLKIAPGKDLSTLANFLEDVNENRFEGSSEEIAAKAEEIIQDIIFDDPSSDIKVVACPYDSSRAKAVYIKEALKKVVLWAQRTMGYFVILDCDTIGLPEGIELDLVEMANRIIVISNTRELEVKKSRLPWAKEVRENGNPNDQSHIDDALVMIRKLTRPLESNGFGIPGNRIRVFFNETSARELKNKVLDKQKFPENMVIGHLDFIKEIDKAWAGDLGDNRNKSIEVAQIITNFMYRATHKNEFDRLSDAMNTR